MLLLAWFLQELSQARSKKDQVQAKKGGIERMGKNQHVVPNKDGWAVKGEGNQRNTVVTKTQREAIDIARQIAKNQGSELFVHGQNGQIRERDSYGNDPYPPKG